MSRGVYRLASLPGLSNQDLVRVAMRVPRGMVCLISALAYHEITTEIPHEVQIALPHGVKKPRLDHPPLRVFTVSGSAFTEGVQTVQIDNVDVRIYDAAKTVVDCFRYRMLPIASIRVIPCARTSIGHDLAFLRLARFDL